MNQLYKERLLEIYSKKENFGNILDKTHEAVMKNPFCEDEITIDLKVDNGKIVEAKFHGKTCFVSTISAEILMENIIGMKFEDALKLTKDDLDNFLGIEIDSARFKCELFPLDALKNIHEITGGRKDGAS